MKLELGAGQFLLKYTDDKEDSGASNDTSNQKNLTSRGPNSGHRGNRNNSKKRNNNNNSNKREKRIEEEEWC